MNPKNTQALKGMEQRYQELTSLLMSPEVLQDQKLLERHSREHKQLEEKVQLWRQYKQRAEELDHVREMIQEEAGEMRQLAEEEEATLEHQLAQMDQDLEQLLLPPDRFSERNAVVEIRAGAGGEEAALFSADLYKMYTKYAEQNGWKTENIDFRATSMGGFREVIFVVEGKQAFSMLRHESGVHRVQRVPVTESSGRVHTSTVTVAVLPEAAEIDNVQIRTDELRIDTFHSSGAGGQHVNVTDSAVRITHMPSGIVVQCQDERSQHQNKAKALRVLRTELLQLKERKQQEEISQERRTQIGTGDRSERIRTYNFSQGRVTDHRVGLTIYNLEEILDGKLDQLLQPLADALRKRQMGNETVD